MREFEAFKVRVQDREAAASAAASRADAQLAALTVEVDPVP